MAGRFFTSWATREAQEYWSGYPVPFPADLSDPGIEPGSPALLADSLPAELLGKLKLKTMYLNGPVLVAQFPWMSRLDCLHCTKENPAQLPRWRLTHLSETPSSGRVSAPLFFPPSLLRAASLHGAKRLFLSFSSFSVEQVSCPSDLSQ